MSRYIRLTVIAIITLIITASGVYLPSIWQAGTIKSLSGIFALTSMLLFVFFRQLNSPAGLGVLNTREMERFTLKRASIRKRFWYVFFLTTLSSGLIWILAGYTTETEGSIIYFLIIGFLFSLNVSYLLSISRWLNDLASFNDKLRLREHQRQAHEAILKRISDAKK